MGLWLDPRSQVDTDARKKIRHFLQCFFELMTLKAVAIGFTMGAVRGPPRRAQSAPECARVRQSGCVCRVLLK